MQNRQINPKQGLIPFSILVVGISSLLFLYLYLGKEPTVEIHGFRKEVAEIFGMAGFCALALIYGRSILKLILNEGTFLQRIIPDDHYDRSLSASRKLLAFLNRTHKHVGATAIVIMATHALLMGPARWNPFLISVLCLLAWQGIFGIFLVVRFPINTLKKHGRMAHAQLYTGVMIGVFAAFGHLLV
ncbi:MAG: hypothetical protein KKB30_16790 [Proteobacteria bacterium]|nr:hypothetical protein [Pseudomonadota bacterium]MBU1715823.1 hypothetical protein [Pseudomonadota bacterium]